MHIKKFFKEYYFQFIVFLFVVIPLLFLIRDNQLKVFLLLIFLLFWLISSFFTKNIVYSSLLFILITLPFNITYQLPLHVLDFTTDPYVSGMYTNYLVPTVSVLDLGIFLLLLSFIHEYGFKKLKIIFYSYYIYLIPLGCFLLLQVITDGSLLVLINSLRFLAYTKALILTIAFFKDRKLLHFLKIAIPVILGSVVLQGILGVLQFSGGASLGLSFLGESQVVSGMMGSSFVTLNNEVFLRAYGTFPHPNILGGYMVMSALLGIFSYFRLKGTWQKLSFLLIILSIFFVVFTFSRIDILLSVVALIVFLFFVFKKKGVYSFSFGLIFTRFTNLLTSGDTSWLDRVNLMRSSFGILKERLLFGTGIGNFTKYMEGSVPRTENGVLLIQPVHNVPLLILSELGLVGSLLYFILLGQILLSNIKRMDWFKCLVILGLVVIGCFDHYLWSLPQGTIIGGILLLLLTA